MRRYAICGGIVLLVGVAACRGRSKKPRGYSTAEQAHRVLLEAARRNDAGAVYDLLHIKTKWSIMSVLRAKQRAHALVQQHYPAERRARELLRTRAAAAAKDARAYFTALSREGPLLDELKDAHGKIAQRRQTAAGVELRSGGRWLAFCREDQQWAYCGMQERFARLNVRAARDLTTVEENVEAFRRGR